MSFANAYNVSAVARERRKTNSVPFDIDLTLNIFQSDSPIIYIVCLLLLCKLLVFFERIGRESYYYCGGVSVVGGKLDNTFAAFGVWWDLIELQ